MMKGIARARGIARLARFYAPEIEVVRGDGHEVLGVGQWMLVLRQLIEWRAINCYLIGKR